MERQLPRLRRRRYAAWRRSREGGRITEQRSTEEIERLLAVAVRLRAGAGDRELVGRALGRERAARARSLRRGCSSRTARPCAERALAVRGGPRPFRRLARRTNELNDADRLRKYLSRFELDFAN